MKRSDFTTQARFVMVTSRAARRRPASLFDDAAFEAADDMTIAAGSAARYWRRGKMVGALNIGAGDALCSWPGDMPQGLSISRSLTRGGAT